MYSHKKPSLENIKTHASMDWRNLLTRSLPLLFLMLPLVLSIVVVPLRNMRSLGSFRNTVTSYRAYVSVIVQLISTFLGLLNILTLTTLTNYATRLWLMSHQTRLGHLSLWTAAALQRVDVSLSPGHIATCVGILVVSQLPGALWAGSLTPVLIHHNREIGRIEVPYFDSGSQRIWNSQFELKGNSVWNNMTFCNSTLLYPSGFVSTCPVPDHRQQLLDHASQASRRAEANLSKIDSPSWIYRDRSTGFGSSPGVVEPIDINPSFQLDKYCYLEEGYEATVECTKNASTAYGYTVLEKDPEYETVWVIQGLLPNTPAGDSEDYPLLSWTKENENRPPPILGWTAVSHGGRNIIAITANERYLTFNQTQCDVFFKRTIKSVYVNQTEKSITVRPFSQGCNGILQNSVNMQDFEPTGKLTANVVRSIRLLSRMGTALYVSDLGEPLKRNLESYFNPIRSGDELRAVEDFFTVMIDDLLVAYGAGQVHFGSSFYRPITGLFKAIRLGDDVFIFALASMNLVFFIIILFEAVRTRFWHALPDFDHTKVHDLIVATSSGVPTNAASEEDDRPSGTVEDVKVKLHQNAREAKPLLFIMYGNSANEDEIGPPHGEEAHLLVENIGSVS